MHGYELIKYLQEKTYGLWTPSPGSVYPTLQLLEDQGMISGEEHDGKRVFSITDTGRREAERMQTGSFADDPMQADAIRQLREANMMVRQMMKRLIRGASTSELKAAADIMLHTQSQLARLFND
jgi:DNA-binding PadR family transcriptional regulator